MRRLLLAALFLVLCAAGASAQAPETTGPFTTGWRDVVFTDPNFGQGTILARIHYPALSPGQNAPADPNTGPHPLMSFQHGWTGMAQDFDTLNNHLASWGFVVASTNTYTDPLPVNPADYARDTRSLLHWVEDQSQTPGSWLEAMAAPGDWVAAGHSLGGQSLMFLIGIEARVRAIAPLMALEASGAPRTNLMNFTGDALFLAGGADWVVPPSQVRAWYDDAVSAERRFYFEVPGMGHSGPTDSPGGSGEIPAATQTRICKRLVSAFQRAERLGEEGNYLYLLGEGSQSETWSLDLDCTDPPFWAEPSAVQGNAFAVGIAGRPGDKVGLAWSLAQASIPTPAGILGLDLGQGAVFFRGLADAEGIRERILPARSAWLGRTVYFQGLVKSPLRKRLSRVASYDVP